MQQTFPTGIEPKVIIAQVRGDLNVSVWDQSAIAIDADGRVPQLYQEGDALMISEGSGDLVLHVPAGRFNPMRNNFSSIQISAET